MSEDLHVVVQQCDTTLGDTGANRARIEDLVRDSRDTDLVVFPELALTGYSVRDRAGDMAISLDGGCPVTLPPEGPAVAFGLVERGGDKLVYNSAAAPV